MLLAALYAATLAPAVTFWDAGELAAAAATLGIPHPPGTPLYVAAAHVWARAMGAPHLTSWAVGAALFSAACTAAAGALLASLVARWTRSASAGVAAALVAGTASSVWANATETEVYAASLLLGAAMLWCGERRARHDDDASGGRWSLLLAYLFALAPALHLSALVAAPAAIVLAASRRGGGGRWREGALLGATTVLAAGVGTASPAIVAAAALGYAGLALAGASPAERRRTVAAAALGLVGASALLVLLVRARHDPALDQGDPATLARLVDVVGRHQYEKVGLLPRRAPLWLQLGNLFEYADWQWALGLSGGVEPSWWRTPITLLFGLLGGFGAREHLRLDRRSWRALLVLLLSGSVGVALYLNLKAGPSFGAGILPADAPHEARERDYFFVLAFWTWGAWAGLGAARLAARGGAWRAAAALAVLPVALNWRATSRRSEPEASSARALGVEMLRSAPPRAVLFTAGDNDSYPLWYAQLALGERRDVTVITVPLLAARWYRAELARRDSLFAPGDVAGWGGEARVIGAIASAARRTGRPVTASVALPPAERAAAGEAGTGWSLRGLTYVARPAASSGGDGASAAWLTPEDSAVTAAVARRLGGIVAERPRPSPDGATQAMHELLGCPALALAAGRGEEARPPIEIAGSTPDSAATVLLDSRCNRR
ncbi:MAG TPA: DUF2723 domain-containing protein [Gemmatimonadaceae bacterium]|nr:DUF2723 domain-containing protein [Gemmatimonadaceae bacterium]